jgi:hypothetical protein
MILGSNGVLKICSLSDNYNVDLRSITDNPETCREKLKELINLYNKAKFENLWYKNRKD